MAMSNIEGTRLAIIVSGIASGDHLNGRQACGARARIDVRNRMQEPRQNEQR